MSWASFDFISEWIDIVDNVDEFNAVERNRVPLFIGSEPELLPAELSYEGVRLKSPVIAILTNTIIVSNKVLGLGSKQKEVKEFNRLTKRKKPEEIYKNLVFKP